jgi:hypothetical protein
MICTFLGHKILDETSEGEHVESRSKTDQKKTGFVGVDWIHLAQDKDT